ncbi:MAG: type III pantothenate kinase [Bacteroides sp.]|nr:type III pantothenate kinase [Bacteroides sp.]MCM1388850.1 type III pantothenate kinase [Bacteroides sp.]
MGYNLVIDQGNSAAKVALFDGKNLVEHWRTEKLEPADLEKIASSYHIDAAIYCSVATKGEEIIVSLRSFVQRVYEMTSMLPLPVKICYATPTTLGRDRIAAVAGAYAAHPGRDVLVVDAGTAVTYDRLTAAGEFAGGNIAPGLWVRAKSLHDMTQRLPLVDVENIVPDSVWGDNTENAIISGVVYGIVGETGFYRSRMPENAIVMLTGGDARHLASLMDFDVEVDPDLVSKGLNSILLYNENI